MDRNQHRRLQSLIRKHVKAQVDLSWKGNQDPEDRVYIERKAEEAEQAMLSYLATLVN